MHLVKLWIGRNAIEDMGPLEGMPLTYLELTSNPVTSLAPLHGMPLKFLGCAHCPQISNLQPLQGMPVENLDVAHCPISDFTVLRGMPLKKLSLYGTRFSDGSVLSGMPLVEIDLNLATSFSKADALAGLPLRILHVRNCPFRDFTPLLRIATLESLETSAPMEKLLPLRAHPGLKQIKLGDAPYRPVAEFWAAYDAQHAGKK